MGKYTIRHRSGGSLRFMLHADNGQVILTSNEYETMSAAMNGIESVRKNSANADRFYKKIRVPGGLTFNLKATNGQVIGYGNAYESDAACENGIASVMRNAPGADVEIIEIK